MLYVSHFAPDTTRLAEFSACLWQGDVPTGLTIHRWIYLRGKPRRIMFIWEARDDEARAYVARFAAFGTITTEEAYGDGTDGMDATFARDLDGFGRWMEAQGYAPEEITRWLDLRRRALEAPDQASAAAAARAWVAGA